MKLGEGRDPLGYDSTDGLPAVGGDLLEVTVGDHVQRCRVLIGEEQQKPNADSALIGVLCDSIRLAREFCRCQSLIT